MSSLPDGMWVKSDVVIALDAEIATLKQKLDEATTGRIARLKQAKREQEKEHADDVVQLVREIAATKNRAEAEIASLRQRNAELCSVHNGLLADGARWQSRAEAAEAENARLRAAIHDLSSEELRLAQCERDAAACHEVVKSDGWLINEHRALAGWHTKHADELQALLAPPAETP